MLALRVNESNQTERKDSSGYFATRRERTHAGKYRLLENIGHGGMADVYRARRDDDPDGAEVCVKVIRHARGATEVYTDSLLQEARLMAGVRHPNVVEMFALEWEEHSPYLVMELVRGIDVGRILEEASQRRVHLPIAAAVFIVRELLLGLSAVHTLADPSGRPLNIVHRDVSPHNVLVSRYGEVKLADFGIAKSLSDPRQTLPGMLKGKYAYMAPEQTVGGAVDARTDVFGAGIVLHELLTCEPAYDAETPRELVRQARDAQIKPAETVRPEIPESLRRVLRTALAKAPGDRYASAAAMAEDLTAVLHEVATGYGMSELAQLTGWLFPSLAPAVEEAAVSTNAELAIYDGPTHPSAADRNATLISSMEFVEPTAHHGTPDSIEDARPTAPPAPLAAPAVKTPSMLRWVWAALLLLAIGAAMGFGLARLIAF